MSADDKEMSLGLDSDGSWWNYGWIMTAVGVVWFLAFLWSNRNRPASQQHSTATCTSNNCARCQALSSSNFTRRLQNRCRLYFETSKSPSATEAQILSLIEDSVERKIDVLSKVYEESGYDIQSQQEDLDQLPVIWMLPGLERHPFWNKDEEYLQPLISTLEDPKTFRAIKNEFTLASKFGQGWKVNSVPSGEWSVYSLVNQGVWNEESVRKCPFTVQLLKEMPAFMKDHVFGNALFSVLKPGSSIEPHTGPCNYRLRCHLPLVTPPGYRLRVGRGVATWKEGEVMVFDDSFVHEVWHDPGLEEEVVSGSRDSAAEGRAVLIFDIWHPQVTSHQLDAVQYIFA